MTRKTLQQKLDELNVWKRGDERAPHKPMLLLLAMGRAVRGEERLVSFREIEAPLTDLLRHFGPPRRAYHPEYAPRGGCGHFPEPVGIAASREGLPEPNPHPTIRGDRVVATPAADYPVLLFLSRRLLHALYAL